MKRYHVEITEIHDDADNTRVVATVEAPAGPTADLLRRYADEIDPPRPLRPAMRRGDTTPLSVVPDWRLRSADIPASTATSLDAPTPA